MLVVLGGLFGAAAAGTADSTFVDDASNAVGLLHFFAVYLYVVAIVGASSSTSSGSGRDGGDSDVCMRACSMANW